MQHIVFDESMNKCTFLVENGYVMVWYLGTYQCWFLSDADISVIEKVKSYEELDAIIKKQTKSTIY
jgi:hypothetical protein